MDDRLYYISELTDFSKILSGDDTNLPLENSKSPIVYVKKENPNESYFILVEDNTSFRRMPELAPARFITSMKLLEIIGGRYMPIFSSKTRELLFSEEEYKMFRNKMSGLKEYGTSEFVFADELYFPGLDMYLEQIDSNFININRERNGIVNHISNILGEMNIGVNSNAGRSVELKDTGSTMRGTNVPATDGNSNWDFDFMMILEYDELDKVREQLLAKLRVANPSLDYLKVDRFRIRLTNVIVPDLEKPVDIDISFGIRKEKYLSTEDALSSRLEQIKAQDEEKYRLVIANIMYAKDLLKRRGAYKPSRSIQGGDRSYGGLGGIGIENWILQNGGSFIEASRGFLNAAEGKDFVEFEKIYPVFDFGKNHVTVSKGGFPYDNFLMKNMRENGYRVMCETLREFISMVNEKEVTHKM